MNHYVVALTIAGSDCCGGAGIQADIKTMSALGVYATSAITAVTVQNTRGVQSVFPLESETVFQQIIAVMDDLRPRAVKIGMVYRRDIILAIARALIAFPPPFLIIDPVLISSSGKCLLQKDAFDALCSELLPLATLVTPNLPEMSAFTGLPLSQCTSNEAARKFLAFGSHSVLVKGGHATSSDKQDYLFSFGNDGAVDYRCFSQPTVATGNTHGTGCTLSAAITSYLARGYCLSEAVAFAKQYITQALLQGSNVEIGSGVGPLNHFFGPQPLIKNNYD